MVTFKQGDIFKSNAQVLVNPVNCVGVMGAGLALEFKKRYPAMFAKYRGACKAGHMALGFVYVIPVERKPSSQIDYVIQFPTKRDWRESSELA